MRLGKMVLQAIPTGNKNATPARTISDRIGIDPHVLREQVNKLRLAGYPIVSNQDGYYMADMTDKADVRGLLESARKLQAHAKSEDEIAKALIVAGVGNMNTEGTK